MSTHLDPSEAVYVPARTGPFPPTGDAGAAGAPALGTGSPVDATCLAGLAASRYASLRSFRRSGDPIDLPVWFVLDGDRVWFRSKRDTAKMRRIHNTPAVELRPCNWKGHATGPAVTGTARILSVSEATVPERRLKTRYGWQWNILPLIRMPGTATTKMDLTWRQRWKHAFATELWPEACIVEVVLDVPPAPR